MPGSAAPSPRSPRSRTSARASRGFGAIWRTAPGPVYADLLDPDRTRLGLSSRRRARRVAAPEEDPLVTPKRGSPPWPKGARCAVMLTFDFDAETLWLRDPKSGRSARRHVPGTLWRPGRRTPPAAAAGRRGRAGDLLSRAGWSSTTPGSPGHPRCWPRDRASRLSPRLGGSPSPTPSGRPSSRVCRPWRIFWTCGRGAIGRRLELTPITLDLFASTACSTPRT